MNNSQFLNMQNVSIITFASSHESVLVGIGENVSLTFSNITVVNNTINIQDNTVDLANLFSFQNTIHQPTLISFVDSCFKDNKVTMSMIKFSEAYSFDLNLTNNTFCNNFGSYGSAVLSIINLPFFLSQLWAISNVFQDNHSSQKGGVFSVNIALETITLLNNIYVNNSAQQGGVGYTGIGDVKFYENNGTYIGNIKPNSLKSN